MHAAELKPGPLGVCGTLDMRTSGPRGTLCPLDQRLTRCLIYAACRYHLQRCLKFMYWAR